MRDVAERAGVSVTTVSHVVNKTRPVSLDARRRVEQAMNDLGYQPNALARSLRRKHTFTIGVIVPDSADPFYAEVIRGIEDASFERGYSMTLCNSDGDLEKERLYTKRLTERRVDGILFFASSNQSKEHVQTLQKRDVSIVVVDRQVPDVETDLVLIDNAAGGWMATRHLMDLGHRRIGCISGPLNLILSGERVGGYRQALAEAALPIDEALIVNKEKFYYQAGYQAAHKLLALPEPPTAIFACNDILAIGAINAAAELGRQVPADLSVIGFDDLRMASYTNPPLTTVAQPKYEMGSIATMMLLERIGDQNPPPQTQMLAIKLLVRQSTGPIKKISRPRASK